MKAHLDKFIHLLVWVQGIYFLLTGLWPFLHLESFLWVTGPKTDIWLLKTVAVLITVIGLTIIIAASRKEVNFTIAFLAMSSAIGLMAVDIYYAVNDVIWDVYLLDAVAEGLLILTWFYALAGRKNKVL